LVVQVVAVGPIFPVADSGFAGRVPLGIVAVGPDAVIRDSVVRPGGVAGHRPVAVGVVGQCHQAIGVVVAVVVVLRRAGGRHLHDARAKANRSL